MKVEINAKKIKNVVNAEAVNINQSKNDDVCLPSNRLANPTYDDTTVVASPDPASEALPLQGRYRILKELGAGGFSNTLLAEDMQVPSRRRCVIKQLNFATNDLNLQQIIQEKFEQEAKVLEALGESNKQIPKLYAYFAEQGKFYLVQELIDGPTLTNEVREFGVMAEEKVRMILINVLVILDQVHSQRIIHRDIKPDNIMMRGADHLPVLIDFGAVKEVATMTMNSQGISGGSIVIGTPGFMSLEQAAGKPVWSSDIYSLGWTAIYLLTGKYPQQIDTDRRTGEILWDKEIPNPLSSFAAILRKATQSKTENRYSTARDMLADLRCLDVTMPAV